MADVKTLYGDLTHEAQRGLMDTGVVAYNLGSPEVQDTASIVADGNMKNGSYTIAGQPDVPRTISITVTKDTANDTMGTITITGTNALDEEITEEVEPNNGDTNSGYTETSNAFKSVSSIVGAGWEMATANDQIQFGYGKKIGLPIALSTIDNVLLCLLDRSVQSHTPAVGDPATVGETVVDASGGTYDGDKVMQVLVRPEA